MKVTVEEYLKKSREECGDRIDLSLHDLDQNQSNALRVEALRDKCDRCGNKPPEQWSDSAKKSGWGRWVFSGGSPSVFGVCQLNECPKREFFLRHAPYKHIRETLHNTTKGKE